jgi:hypothetical protein
MPVPNEQFQVHITPRALEYIRSTMIPAKSKEPYAIIVTTAGRIGGGYMIITQPIPRIQSAKYYIELQLKTPDHFDFPLYAEPILLNGNFIPNPFVIDLVAKSHGIMKLDIKNPEFETF